MQIKDQIHSGRKLDDLRKDLEGIPRGKNKVLDLYRDDNTKGQRPPDERSRILKSIDPHNLVKLSVR